MRKVITYISVAYLALWSIIMPDTAKAYVFKVKCAEFGMKYWTVANSKTYAKFIMSKYGWGRGEWKALDKLWTKESHWNPLAYNVQVGDPTDGSHAGGIPQMLSMSIKTPAPVQIDKGLSYIKHRYGRPSVAWAHHRVHNWY